MRVQIEFDFVPNNREDLRHAAYVMIDGKCIYKLGKSYKDAEKQVIEALEAYKREFVPGPKVVEV